MFNGTRRILGSIVSSVSKFVSAEVKAPSHHLQKNFSLNLWTPQVPTQFQNSALRRLINANQNFSGGNLAIGQTIFKPSILRQQNSIAKLIQSSFLRKRGLTVALGLAGILLNYRYAGIVSCEAQKLENERQPVVNVGVPKTIFSRNKQYTGMSRMMGSVIKGEKLRLCTSCDNKENHYQSVECQKTLELENQKLRLVVQKANFEISLLKSETTRNKQTIDLIEKENVALSKDLKKLDLQLRAANKEVQTQRSTIETMKESEKAAHQEHLKLSQEMNDLKSNNDQLMKNSNSKEEKIMNLEEKLCCTEQKLQEKEMEVSELKDRLSEDFKYMECISCMNKESEIVYGCGHLISCHDCDQSIKSIGNDCPVCRSPIQSRIRIFRI